MENIVEVDSEDTMLSILQRLSSSLFGECLFVEKRRIDRCKKADEFIMHLKKAVVQKDESAPIFKCPDCKFIAKNKGGLSNHLKVHKKKM